MTSTPTFRIARELFLRLLALTYAIAFLSLAVQIRGLIGEHGILPAAEFLPRVSEVLGADAYLRLPTLLWVTGASDTMLVGACVAGVVLSAFVLVGVATRLSLFFLWALYLSLYLVGRDFLGYQWDSLLLETGLLAIVLAPKGWRPSFHLERSPSWIALGLLWWLLFRLMFASGVVKLQSGDPTWDPSGGLTALEYHFFTQPIPNPIAWWMHGMSDGLLSLSGFLMFGVELALPIAMLAIPLERYARVPFLALARYLVFAGFTGLMLLIMLTGNYGFFNLLAICLCVLLLDDALFLQVLPRRPGARLRATIETAPLPSRSRFRTVALAAVAIPLFAVATTRFAIQLLPVREIPAPVRSVLSAFGPFSSANTYGLFAVMTTHRAEIRIEGSDDAVEWKPYRFRYKPGDPSRRPPFVAPHMPRLDWQMWFAALEYDRPESLRRGADWLQSFLLRLFENRPAVTALLAENPFPDEPPRYLRATLAKYEFTDAKTRRETGAWWEVEEEGLFFPVVENPRD